MKNSSISTGAEQIKQGKSFFVRGYYYDAITSFNKALKECDLPVAKEMEALYYKALSCEHTEGWKEALEAYNEILEITSEDNDFKKLPKVKNRIKLTQRIIFAEENPELSSLYYNLNGLEKEINNLLASDKRHKEYIQEMLSQMQLALNKLPTIEDVEVEISGNISE